MTKIFLQKPRKKYPRSINAEAMPLMSVRNSEKMEEDMETRPGRTPLETLEENILMILDEAKTESGNVAKSFLVLITSACNDGYLWC